MPTLIPKFDLMNGGSTPTGAINRSIQNKLSDYISVKDFGAVGDGTTDDTTAIQNAINSLSSTGGSVYFPTGQYLISTTLTVSTQGITLFGSNSTALWDSATSILSGGSQIVKKSTMTTDAIQVSNLRFQMQDLAVRGQSGNTGDGVYLQNGYSPALINVSVAGVGGSGIRIGSKTNGNYNVNGWQLTNVTSQKNNQHGVLIYDQTTAGLAGSPNANAGTAIGLNVSANSGEGLRIENGQFNTFIGLLSQQNSNYGVVLIGTSTLSLYATFNGGDVEANAVGNWYLSGNAQHITIMGAFSNYPTLDPNQFNTSFIGGNCAIRGLYFQTGNILQYYINGTGTPIFFGSTQNGFNSYTSQNLYYTRVGNAISCQGSLQLSAKGTSSNAMIGSLGIQLDTVIPICINQTGATAVFSISCYGGLTVGAGFSPNLIGIMQPNTRYMTIYKTSTTDGSLTALTASDITDSFKISFSGTYLTTP